MVFMTHNAHLVGGIGYIIFAVDYCSKWAEAMPTYNNSGKIASLFLFNHISTGFVVPHAIATDHGKHFHSYMMSELIAKLRLQHDR